VWLIVCLRGGRPNLVSCRPRGDDYCGPGVLFTEPSVDAAAQNDIRTSLEICCQQLIFMPTSRRCSTVFCEEFQANDLQSGNQETTIVARDRGGGYGEATAKALPHPTLVADRWRLMDNASRALLNAARKPIRQIRIAIGATTVNPELLTRHKGGSARPPRVLQFQLPSTK